MRKKIIQTKITKRDKNEEKCLMNTKSQNSKYTKFVIKIQKIFSRLARDETLVYC